jgi:hypothetical protein
MREESTYLGIDLTGGAIRVVASNGQRSSINGILTSDAEARLELALYGLSLPPDRAVYACVAVPCRTPVEESRELALAASRSAVFDGVYVCPAPFALARGCQRSGRAIAVVVEQGGSSIALVRDGTLEEEDQDFVRPIAGREARELAVSARCLLKRFPRPDARELLEWATVGGEPEEIERIRKSAIERELESIGAKVEFFLDPFVVSIGACHLARELDRDSWLQTSEVGHLRRTA